jgi:hypothetical protein
MKLLRMIAVTALGMALALPSALAADAAAVRTMMEKSGLVAQYTDLGGQMRDALFKSPPPMLQSGTASLMATIVGNTMDGKQVLDQVQTILAGSLSADDLKAMDAFFDSDLGSRIVKAEIAGSTPAAQDQIDAKAQQLLAEARQDPQRVALFEDIDRKLNTSELSARASQSLLRALSTAMAESSPMPPDPNKVAQANAHIDAMHAALVKEAQLTMIASAEWIYRDFSLTEMQSYATFLESEPSQIMYAAVSAVLDGFYAETGKRIGDELAAAVRQQKT